MRLPCGEAFENNFRNIFCFAGEFIFQKKGRHLRQPFQYYREFQLLVSLKLRQQAKYLQVQPNNGNQ